MTPDRLRAFADAGRSTTRAHSVTFGAIDDLAFADADAWLDHALPVAGTRAYPIAAELRRDGSVRRLDARQLACAEALLRALAETTDEELDAGRWHKRPHAFDGPIDLHLTLPFLLEGEAGQTPKAASPAVLPRALERTSVRIARMVEGRSFESLDDLNAEVDRAGERGLFEMPAEAAAGRALSALERAQELAFDAMEASGRLQHVITDLVDPEAMPFDRPPQHTLGSKDEAAYVADELGDAYDATSGLASWLRSRTTGRRLGRRSATMPRSRRQP